MCLLFIGPEDAVDDWMATSRVWYNVCLVYRTQLSYKAAGEECEKDGIKPPENVKN